MTGSPRLPRWLGTVVRVVLTVIAVAWISRSVRPGAALEELRAAPTWVFAIPAGLLMVNAALHGVRLVVLLDGLGVVEARVAVAGAGQGAQAAEARRSERRRRPLLRDAADGRRLLSH